MKLEEGAAFCPNCGAKAAGQSPAAETAHDAAQAVNPAAGEYKAAPAYEAPVYNEEAYVVAQKKELETKSFVLAIVAACLASLGLPGLIMGIIGLNKVKKFYGEGGKGYWKSIITKTLSIYAIISGAVFTLMWILYIIYFAIIIAAIGNMSW